MKDYSWLQKRLHQFALSSQFMREVTFDAEKSLIRTNKDTDNHVFVVGLARSGTTVLLNALYKSNEFASLLYKDVPFVLAPNLWSKLLFNKQDINLVERAHGDSIKISTESPEAFEEVFWMTFNENDNDVQEKFKSYVQIINKKYQKNRYLSKNNQNIRRLDLISKTFTKSNILIPFRNPLQQAYSLLSQHKRFINYSKKDKFISNYMRWIGHTEFGPNYIPIHQKNLTYGNNMDINHWIEQWCLSYTNCCETLKLKDNIHLISYEELCSSKEYWLGILRMLEIENTYSYEFKESQKDIPIKVDESIANKALSLYMNLSNIALR
ncbi:sulfotransferase [Gammaproteobacteria bacterium]|nr:sulfotransferase [Gammaproteobacteria bacterium]